VADEGEDYELRRTIGRYALYGEVAAGGMATVHYGRLIGPVGFARTVAIKRLLSHLALDPDFVRMFVREARLAARVSHPNVVPILDVVEGEGDLLIVMEYIRGESLSRLLRVAKRQGKDVPLSIVTGIMCGVLEGLHAAHEAVSERGEPLGIVHRDVSPQNILVGVDGVPRVLDFGVAKATSRASESKADHIKGKISYMAPEQLAHGEIDRRTDIFSASVVLWQALAGEKLFQGDDVSALVHAVIADPIRPPSEKNPKVPQMLDGIVLKGLDREAKHRFESAQEMAIALEKACPPAPAREIGAWVRDVCGEAVAYREQVIAEIENDSATSMPPSDLARMRPSAAPTAPEDGRESMATAPEGLRAQQAAALLQLDTPMPLPPLPVIANAAQGAAAPPAPQVATPRAEPPAPAPASAQSATFVVPRPPLPPSKVSGRPKAGPSSAQWVLLVFALLLLISAAGFLVQTVLQFRQ